MRVGLRCRVWHDINEAARKQAITQHGRLSWVRGRGALLITSSTRSIISAASDAAATMERLTRYDSIIPNLCISPT